MHNTSFKNRDGANISARIELPPDGLPRAFVLLAHCFTCSKDLTAHRRIARVLTGSGLGVMSFDFTGLGASGGDFSETSFSSQASDLIDAADYLAERYQPPSFLVGHSLGGTACLYAARELPSVRGVATIGAPAAPAHVEKLFVDHVGEIEEAGSATVSIGGRPFTIKKEFIEDIRNNPPEQWIGELKADLFILHSPVDTVVGVENAERIFKATRHPKSFVSLREADHLLSRPEDAEYAGSLVGAWIRALLPKQSDDKIETNQQVAARIGREQYTVQIQAGKHAMVADEPASAGGRDLGGNPYDYLLASLGACTAMTLRMYADRKEIPLESVTVHLSHRKVHATDQAACMADGTSNESLGGKPEAQAPAMPAMIDAIDRVIVLDGDLSPTDREKLLAIADKCPVHRTLGSKTVVETRLG